MGPSMAQNQDSTDLLSEWTLRLTKDITWTQTSQMRKHDKRHKLFYALAVENGERCNVVGWGTVLQAERLRVRIPVKTLEFFNFPNLSSHTMTPRFTQFLIEMSSRNLPRGKARPELKTDALAAICELIF
jgi:hypothetical protein